MATRHLIVLDKSIDKPTRRVWKSRRRPDVDLVSACELDDVAHLVGAKFLDRKTVRWDTISLIFNAHCDEHEHGRRHATVMGVHLNVDVGDGRFKTCANNATFQTLVRKLSAMVASSGVDYRGIYLYALNSGHMPGWQQLLKPDTAVYGNATAQVFLSNGANENDDGDWRVDWGSKAWYDVTPDQRKHAKRHLFHMLKTPADGQSLTYDTYLKYHKEARRATFDDECCS